MITKEEFKKFYADNSGITLEEYDEEFIAVPCNCGEGGCQGWTTFRKKHPDTIEMNLDIICNFGKDFDMMKRLKECGITRFENTWKIEELE